MTFVWDESTHGANSIITVRKSANVVTMRLWNVVFSQIISTDTQVGHITNFASQYDHSFMFCSGDQSPVLGSGYISTSGKVYVSHYQIANKYVYGTITLVL